MKIDETTDGIIRELNEIGQAITKGEVTFESLRQSAQAVRLKTKRLRELWKDRASSLEREFVFQTSIESLDRVISVFVAREAGMEKGSLSERDIALEIGDCYGAQGGVYRDWHKFREAADAYRKGNEYAKRVTNLGGAFSSYCLVQELINTILAEPESLNQAALRTKIGAALQAVKHTEEPLAPDAERKEEELKLFKKEAWAQADQALLTQLLDPDQAIEEWDALDDLKPKPNVYAATRTVVVALLDSLRPHLPPALLESWEDVVDRLK
jgi:hypothetical protein